jgi:hypothetical protein
MLTHKVIPAPCQLGNCLRQVSQPSIRVAVS